jgi:hypothetical protein
MKKPAVSQNFTIIQVNEELGKSRRTHANLDPSPAPKSFSPDA